MATNETSSKIRDLLYTEYLIIILASERNVYEVTARILTGRQVKRLATRALFYLHRKEATSAVGKA